MKYDKFWDIAKQQLDELTAVNDRHHTEGFINTGEVVVNMAIVISARDLYEKIKAEGIKQGLINQGGIFLLFLVQISVLAKGLHNT